MWVLGTPSTSIRCSRLTPSFYCGACRTAADQVQRYPAAAEALTPRQQQAMLDRV